MKKLIIVLLTLLVMVAHSQEISVSYSGDTVTLTPVGFPMVTTISMRILLNQSIISSMESYIGQGGAEVCHYQDGELGYSFFSLIPVVFMPISFIFTTQNGVSFFMWDDSSPDNLIITDQDENPVQYKYSDTTLIFGSNISGTVYYNGTPMECSIKFGNFTVNTDANGYWEAVIPMGGYSIDILTPVPPGGVNTSDAMMVLRFFVQLDTFTPLQYMASDVNGDGVVNASDALSIVKYFTQNGGYTPKWVWDKPILIVGGDSIFDLNILKSGDVNGSLIQ